MSHSCVYPTNNTLALAEYEGHVTNPPAFVAFAANDFRLTPGSPCVNAGTNQPWMDGAHDLDGRTRVDRFSGRVDMGGYEGVPRGALLRIR